MSTPLCHIHIQILRGAQGILKKRLGSQKACRDYLDRKFSILDAKLHYLNVMERTTVPAEDDVPKLEPDDGLEFDDEVEFEEEELKPRT